MDAPSIPTSFFDRDLWDYPLWRKVYIVLWCWVYVIKMERKCPKCGSGMVLQGETLVCWNCDLERGVGEDMYDCEECGHQHRYDSKIGMEHLEYKE